MLRLKAIVAKFGFLNHGTTMGLPYFLLEHTRKVLVAHAAAGALAGRRALRSSARRRGARGAGVYPGCLLSVVVDEKHPALTPQNTDGPV